MKLAIFDKGDNTYHYGDGEWGRDKDKAALCDTDAEAKVMLDDVDCDEFLRHRLMVVVVT